ncbi:MAG: hypothetical protein GX771_07660 [Halomonadaceae bacterium]|nr:hypothetical protein [Halomonadaceae bacterium]
MSRHATDADHQRNTLTRPQRKAELIAALEQQRIDLLVESERWQHASTSLDAGWLRLVRYRSVLYLAGGALLLNSARRPKSLLRVAKRVAAGGLLLSRARRLLRLIR